MKLFRVIEVILDLEKLKLNTTYNLAIEQKERAFYLSLAAILGDGIYNFGELVDKV